MQYVDGPEECRKAVREQVMYDADLIKYYSDRGYFYVRLWPARKEDRQQ